MSFGDFQVSLESNAIFLTFLTVENYTLEYSWDTKISPWSKLSLQNCLNLIFLFLKKTLFSFGSLYYASNALPPQLFVLVLE